MSFNDIILKKAYSSDIDDILDSFLVPVLQRATQYDRLAGFFSSTALAVAARGILGLIKNAGVVRLIVSPRLNKEDLKVILDSEHKENELIEKSMQKDMHTFDNDFVKDHVSALGWMLLNNKLEIKVALIYDKDGRLQDHDGIQESGIFHQKVGIFKDIEGNILTFSGSVNETALGWLGNIEEFKVFRSWEPSEMEYVIADNQKFERFWQNQSKQLKIIPVPQAVKEQLIQLAPSDLSLVNLERWQSKTKKRVVLFDHQTKAIQSWTSNAMRGIFEMATGTGKTLTALGCVEKAFEIGKQILIIISCPYQHLGQQWEREIQKYGILFDKQIFADSSNPKWKNEFADSLTRLALGYIDRLCVITTHRSLQALETIILHKNRDVMILIIADEVHGLGAEEAQKGLSDLYNLRLGLSATPKRYFDILGTDKLYNYFNGVVYEFSLEQAINSLNPATGETYLTPYHYNVNFVFLSEEELSTYYDKTCKILQKYYKADTEPGADEYLSILLFERARIVKNAEAKYKVLNEILDELKHDIQGTLIYTSPQQINPVMKMIGSKKLIAHRFTMSEGMTPKQEYQNLSERDFILKAFSMGRYEILVAMKCLDEGIDVPSARNTILMASSGNPREFIQRIGRVIRRFPNKKEAKIYDTIVIPQKGKYPDELFNLEKRIFRKELERYEEIAMNAINGATVMKLIDVVKAELWG